MQKIDIHYDIADMKQKLMLVTSKKKIMETVCLNDKLPSRKKLNPFMPGDLNEFDLYL